MSETGLSDKGSKAGNSASCCSASGTSGSPFIRISDNPNLKASPNKIQNKLSEWICGTVLTKAGPVYQITSDWSGSDFWGQVKCRISAFRNHYIVPPGLYAVGQPDETSDVFASANYKLSFDILRRALKGLNVWILVLDTKGINVWCAAGKGSFGSKELVQRIRAVQMEKVINHKKIIIPQLSAPGVNSLAVRKETGFRVLFGPVSARDIPAYINRGYKSTEKMRAVRFTMLDRLVLTPMEINPAIKKYYLFALPIALITGLQPAGILFRDIWLIGAPLLLLGLASVFIGALLTPLFLPYVPSRSFAIKGWIMGMIGMPALVPLMGDAIAQSIWLMFFSYIFFPLASSYIALQFTGSTTFTGISGVKKELKFGIPIYIGGSAVSILLLILFKLAQWSVI